MASPNRRIIMGQEITRSGLSWQWHYGPSDWSWTNGGDGGTVRPSAPELVAADVGQWADTLEQAAIWVAGFCEGYEAGKLRPGERLTTAHSLPRPTPPTPPPAPPPLAVPIDATPPKGGAK